MMFDVGIRTGFNEAGKEQYRFVRMHHTKLSSEVRRIQVEGMFIFSVRIMFPMKENRDDTRDPVEDFVEDPINGRVMVDSHGM